MDEQQRPLPPGSRREQPQQEQGADAMAHGEGEGGEPKEEERGGETGRRREVPPSPSPRIDDAEPPVARPPADPPGASAAETRLQVFMDEQKQNLIIYEQRLAQLETRTTVVEVRQNQLELAMTRQADAMAKLADVLAVQANKSTIHEAAIDAIRQRTDDHNRHIEELQRETRDMSIKMNATAGRVTVVWRVVATIGGATALVVLEYIFSHFLPR